MANPIKGTIQTIQSHVTGNSQVITLTLVNIKEQPKTLFGGDIVILKKEDYDLLVHQSKTNGQSKKKCQQFGCFMYSDAGFKGEAYWCNEHAGQALATGKIKDTSEAVLWYEGSMDGNVWVKIKPEDIKVVNFVREILSSGSHRQTQGPKAKVIKGEEPDRFELIELE